MVVSNDNDVVVYLNCVPFGIRLHYYTNGKLDNYTVEINRMGVDVIL